MGKFPPGWAEWNDRYRDGLRGFWRGDDGRLGDVAQRLTGSQDLYEWSGKRPSASINFITAHDGFTLHDLVSYNAKHNEANGEDNRDGSDHNLSWNCGAEGPTDDPAVNALRERQKRNLLATLLLSHGVPMLLAGDERGNTQGGNNNAYCQDNETGWIDWMEAPERAALFAFVSRLIALRRDHPSFRRRNFFTGQPIEGDPIRDIGWMKPDGSEMQVDDWATLRALAMFVSGHGIAERGPRGERLFDDDFLLLVNAQHEPVEIVLPHGFEPQLAARRRHGRGAPCRGRAGPHLGGAKLPAAGQIPGAAAPHAAAAMTSGHDMPFGAAVEAGGGVRFALWAPSAGAVVLELLDRAAPAHTVAAALPLQRAADGWHTLHVAQAGAGDRYRFRVAHGLAVPDPASRCNPDDVHAASAVVDPRAYRWRDRAWRGRPWREAVIYELHVGTFSAEGTFAAAAARLPALAELGITAIELMPVADFPGRRNWGYDGVLPFAPDAAYGTPDELKALVDSAHGLGLMVFVDVVYNHFGPDGNYLHAYCPEFFNPARATPWGAAINFDGDRARTVRDFFVHNALYWVEEFHVDGLRMDAIHAIRDDSAAPIVREICAALRDGPGRARQVHVVVENDANEAALLGRDRVGVPAAATAQWNDDFHHAAHVLLTGETRRLLRRLRGRSARQAGPRARRGLRLPGTGVGVSRRRSARRAERSTAAGRLRLVAADARPGRQSRVRRAHRHARRPYAARCCLRLPAAGPARADALHGRGVRGVDAVLLLL